MVGYIGDDEINDGFRMFSYPCWLVDQLMKTISLHQGFKGATKGRRLGVVYVKVPSQESMFI